MVELMNFTNGVLFWDVSFFRSVHAWELEELLGFMDTIHGASVKGFGEDKMCWKPNREKGFMVKDFYSLLVGSNEYCFPWKSIWKQKIHSQVPFFVWIAALGKCLTIGNLQKRKVWILNWCYMCKMVNRLIIFFFIVWLLWTCGLWCLVCLVVIEMGKFG